MITVTIDKQFEAVEINHLKKLYAKLCKKQGWTLKIVDREGHKK